MSIWLVKWWQARQRQLDLTILWPACKTVAQDIDEARRTFALHVYRDRAWLSLSPVEISRILADLS